MLLLLFAKYFSSAKKSIKRITAQSTVTLFVFQLLMFPCFAQDEQPAGINNDIINSTSTVDSSAWLLVKFFNITGNKKTKRYIIEREINFKPGDSIMAATIFEKLESSRQLIYNTNLFESVELKPRFISGEEISVDVTVKEKWYIYPTPQFQLSDRSFNEWVKRYNADLDRVTYGAKFAHYNLSGRRDVLRVYLLNGFARNISVQYSAPYSNRKLTEGFGIGAGFNQTRATIYKTNAGNLPLRYSTPARDFVRHNFSIAGSYVIRKGFYKRQIFSIGYAYTKVEDSVVTKYNPSYYNKGNDNSVHYPEVGYAFQYLHTNNINYPLTGKIYSVAIAKKGVGFSGGINALTLGAGYNRYVSLGKSWYHSLSANGKIKLPFNQPYVNQAAMGYEDYYLRGLENYVIDGVASILAKYTLKKKVIAFSIPVPVKNKFIQKVPFQIFAKTFADGGYNYNKFAAPTILGNRFVYTGGFGLDVLTFYDINFSMEYSFNQLNEKGLFLHVKGGF